MTTRNLLLVILVSTALVSGCSGPSSGAGDERGDVARDASVDLDADMPPGDSVTDRAEPPTEVVFDLFADALLDTSPDVVPKDTGDDAFSDILPDACQPDCEGKVCGDDGCGGSCGDCMNSCDPQCNLPQVPFPDPSLCMEDGTVCAQVCCPNCCDRVCGDDGCGGSCGECGPTAGCIGGECVPYLVGACSATGVTCYSDDDCLPSPAQVTGFCVVGNGGWGRSCLYESRFPSDQKVTCGALTFSHCEGFFDCPNGIYCSSYGPSWCGVDVEGVCSLGEWCTDDAACSRWIPNLCVLCGNGILDTPQEHCDDGNSVGGDGCSSRCLFEGTCITSEGWAVYGQGCASDADCQTEDCEYSGAAPCTCSLD